MLVRSLKVLGRRSTSPERRPRQIPSGYRAPIDYALVNRAALDALPALLARWLPGGTRIGRDYVALNPTRGDRRPGSFKVLLTGPRAGAWADFATGDRGGDPVSLAAYLHRLGQAEAATRLARMLGVSRG
jgi:hypothetical protein